MAAGCLKGMTLEETAAGFSKAELTANRLNVIKKDGITVIDDTYNAAPDSMKGAIDTLMSTPVPEGGRRIAILGDMGELGFESNRGHGEVGAYAHRKGVDVTLAVGPNSYAAYKGWGNDAAQEGHGLRLIPTGPGMPLIETDEQTGRITPQIPHRVTAHPLKFGRQTLITRICLVRDLAIYRKCRSIRIDSRLC